MISCNAFCAIRFGALDEPGDFTFDHLDLGIALAYGIRPVSCGTTCCLLLHDGWFSESLASCKDFMYVLFIFSCI